MFLTFSAGGAPRDFVNEKHALAQKKVENTGVEPKNPLLTFIHQVFPLVFLTYQ